MSSPTNHARLGASSSKRWMTCPGSVVLEEQMDEETSAYAEEGTKAHALAEAKLRHLMGRILPEDVDEVRKGCDPEMDIMTDRYVEYAKDIIDQMLLAGHAPYWGVETRVRFDRWVPEGFGTVDLFIVGGGHLHIIDLKYGKGVPVSAIGNPQPRAYSLGFLQDFELIYDNIETVTYHIVQPRLNNNTSETMAVDELMKWAEEELRPRALKAWNGTREYNPGEHCKFCRAKAVCKARAARILNTIASVLGPAK